MSYKRYNIYIYILLIKYPFLIQIAKAEAKTQLYHFSSLQAFDKPIMMEFKIRMFS